MHIETLFDQIEEQYDAELAGKSEYRDRCRECRECINELEKTLSPEQKEQFLNVEERMNDISAYIAEFYFWKGYERGITDEKERYKHSDLF